MLVLSRKTDQTIVLGSDIVVTVVAVHGNRVKLGIQAPSDVRVLRGELQAFPSEREECANLSLETATLQLDTTDSDMNQTTMTLPMPR